MNRTPLLRKLREDGATLYVFPSANEDIGLNLNSRATGVAMSHYALLNLPKICDNTELLALDLLNYVMNFETLLINQDSYNYLEYHTVSERVFWHWLISKRNKIVLNTDKKYCIEKDLGNRIVLCFGSIDAGNSLSTEFGMFNETYINIPSSYGNGPVFFKECVDENYGKVDYIVTSNTENLLGRTAEDQYILQKNDPIYDEGTKYSVSDSFEIVKDINEIQAALKMHGISGVNINSYDDVNIDNSKLFEGSTFDITTNKVEFNFNAILLYYSVYDLDDITKTAYATNLFGIIFLNAPDEKTGLIEGITKRKSYSGSGTNYFGNSYSFRVNIKTMSVYDNSDEVILDNTTMSSITSVDLSDVISNLNRAIDVMNTNVLSTMSIQDLYMSILRYYDEYKERIDDISTKLYGFINGNKTSLLITKSIRTNNIIPENKDSNQINISLNSLITSVNSGNNIQNNTYTPSIIISNNLNIPTVYKPVFNTVNNDTSLYGLGKWIDTSISDIIDNISIGYYDVNNIRYVNMELPKEKIDNNNLKCLYCENSSNNITHINYDELIPLMISYIKELKKEINELKKN